MKRRVLGWFALVLLPAVAFGRIEAPDHVIYGNVSLFGAPAPNGTVIELRSQTGDVPLARYTLGREPRLGNQFSLRIPMDTVEPRPPGRARPGDPVRIYIGTRLAAETSVGEVGVAVRLDLDPQNLGTGPGIQIDNPSVLEGNAATTPITFTLTLNTTSPDPVSLTWQTQNGTAVGAPACAAGVDYVSDGGTVQIAAGALQQTFAVALCGDTVAEPNETFTVQLSNVSGGVLMSNSATGTVIDDDDVPELSVPDARALEPASGMVDLVFRPRLSRPSAVMTSFNFATQNLSAIAGADYIARNGTVQIPAGQLQGEVRIAVLADATTEAREQFRLVLSAPIALRLQRVEAFGDIVDPQFEPAVYPEDEVTGTSLAGPSDIVLSPDGAHAYVASESLDSILAYVRTPANGRLSQLASYTAASSGYGGALLDGPSEIAVSADGRHLYVAARNSNAVVVLERTASTGELGFVQNQTSPALLGASAVHVSSDDQHVYVAGGTANSIAVYRRDTGTGALALLEVESNNGNDASDAGPTVTALDRPAGITSSRNGAQVYVASRFGNSVAVFDRASLASGAGFGRLSFVASLRNGLQGVQGIAGAYDLVLGPDDAQLYVIGELSNSVSLFDRAANGTLVWRTRYSQGDPGVHGLGGPQAISIAPDGTEVYVAGFADDSFSVFRRTAATGALTIQQTVFDGEGQVALMNGPVAIAASADNRYVYVAASTDNAIVIFSRAQGNSSVFGNGFE